LFICAKASEIEHVQKIDRILTRFMFHLQMLAGPESDFCGFNTDAELGSGQPGVAGW